MKMKRLGMKKSMFASWKDLTSLLVKRMVRDVRNKMRVHEFVFSWVKMAKLGKKQNVRDLWIYHMPGSIDLCRHRFFMLGVATYVI
jgi:hypothetical protein